MAKAEAIFNNKEWRVFLKSMEKKLDNPSKLLKNAYFISGFKDITDHFDKERGPRGKWKKRSKRTQKTYAMIGSGKWKNPENTSRAQFNPGNKLLQMTGATRNNIDEKNVKSLSKFRIKITNNAPNSGVHNKGSTKRNIPQREFMWISRKGWGLMSKIILNDIAGA